VNRAVCFCIAGGIEICQFELANDWNSLAFIVIGMLDWHLPVAS
jgi:hypothetical protein